MEWDDGKYACCHGRSGIFTAGCHYDGKAGGYVVTVLGRRLKRTFAGMEEGKAAAVAALRKACIGFLKENPYVDEED